MLITDSRELGHLVRERRRQRNLSQRKLAEAIGVSRHWVMALERGNAGAELGLVLKTLSVLGLRVDVQSRPQAAADPVAEGTAQVLDRARADDAPPRRLNLHGRRRP